ncbi:RHS repeat-associated core domain-containing protein [Sorangium sp. So ce119]|uniref:RHS repeat-associated core domain-containing protein n=1 Tax=Sorangium sp. So ce119 TaxID=3133279 RepID=UPI003F5E802C
MVFRPNGTIAVRPRPDVGAEVDLGGGVRLRRDPEAYVLVDADGLVHLFERAPGGEERWILGAIADLSGNRIVLAYRGRDLVSITDSVGRIVHVRRDARGHIVAFDIDGGGGRAVRYRTYQYDAAGDLAAVYDGDGHAVRFAYDEHRLTRVAYAGGLRVHYRYDERGRCVETWCDYPEGVDPALANDVPEYLADGRTQAKGVLHCRFEYAEGYTEVINSLQVRRYEINPLGKVDKATNGRGVTTVAYDEHGHLRTYADENAASTTYHRDAGGRLVGTTDPTGATTRFAYNQRGNLEEVVDALGHFARYHYDAYSRLVETVDELGSVIRFDHDNRGQRVRATMPDGAETVFRYDAHGNLVELVEPHGKPRRLRYDEVGRVVSFVNEEGHATEFFYDGRGLLTTVRMPNGGVQRVEHDADGRPVRLCGADGGVYQLSWGGYGLVHEIRKPTGESVRFRYDRECNLVQVINERGEVHRLLRDVAGRVVGERTFDGRSYEYRLDNAGDLVGTRSGGGMTVEMTRDPCGRVTDRRYADETAERFEYDPLGRLIAAETEHVRCEFTYDARGRLLRETQTFDGRTHAVESDYSPAGHRTALRTSLCFAARFEPNVMGRPARVLLGGDAAVAFEWDALDSETARVLPAGGTVRSRFDVMGFLVERHVVTPGARAPAPQEPQWVGRLPPGTTFAVGYAYSPGGEVIAEHRADIGRRHLSYDPMGRILASLPAHAGAEAYAYDEAGAVYETSSGAPGRSYGPGGVLARRGTAEYVYDRDMRCVEQREPSTQSTTRYEWNARGMLAAVVRPDGTRVENVYDAFARRIAKRVMTPDGKAATTRFVWDRDVLVHEVKEPGAAGQTMSYRTYVHRTEGPHPLAHRDTVVVGDDRRDSEWVHYIQGQGEHPAVLVSGRGEVLADLRPTIWGHVEPSASARAETPLRYPGQYFDEETGLCYNRYRFYEPRIGRYVSPDPVGLLGGLDPFAYCHQQPFRFHDPLGLAPPVTTEVSGSAGSFRQDSGGQPGRIHPVVESAFPPRAPDNNGIYPGHRSGGIPPGQSPTACGEPRALSRYIEAWEGQHRRDPTTGQVRPLDPSNPSDHGDIQRCLQSIDGISSTQPRSDGTVGARAPCPNCSQLLANLHQQYGQPNPSVIRPGATSRDGTDSTNFSPPSMDWVRAQQAAIAAGRGRSGPQPPVTHTRGSDGSLTPSAVPAPTGPAYPPHSGYGTVYP